MGFTYAAASLENGTQTYAKFTRWSRTATFSFFPPLSIETEQNSTPTCFDPFDKVENLGGIVPNCRMTARKGSSQPVMSALLCLEDRDHTSSANS